jgi:hypothetical protein
MTPMKRTRFVIAMACLASALPVRSSAQDRVTVDPNKQAREQWQSRVNANRERLEQRREEMRLDREKRLAPKREELRLDQEKRIDRSKRSSDSIARSDLGQSKKNSDWIARSGSDRSKKRSSKIARTALNRNVNS